MQAEQDLRKITFFRPRVSFLYLWALDFGYDFTMRYRTGATNNLWHSKLGDITPLVRKSLHKAFLLDRRRQAEIRLQQSRWDDEQTLWNLWRTGFSHFAAAHQSFVLVIWRGEGSQLWWDRWSRTQCLHWLLGNVRAGIFRWHPIPHPIAAVWSRRGTLAAWGGPRTLQWPAAKIPFRHSGNLGKENSQGQSNSFSSFQSIWSWRKRKSNLARKR